MVTISSRVAVRRAVIHAQHLTRTRNGPTRKRGLTPKPTRTERSPHNGGSRNQNSPMNRNLPGYVKKTIRRLGGGRGRGPVNEKEKPRGKTK